MIKKQQGNILFIIHLLLSHAILLGKMSDRDARLLYPLNRYIDIRTILETIGKLPALQASGKSILIETMIFHATMAEEYPSSVCVA